MAAPDQPPGALEFSVEVVRLQTVTLLQLSAGEHHFVILPAAARELALALADGASTAEWLTALVCVAGSNGATTEEIDAFMEHVVSVHDTLQQPARGA